jgi:tetratricopeptide (TPR) repeat protein
MEWKDVRRSIPFFATAFALGLVTLWFQHHIDAGHEAARTDGFPARLAGAGWAAWFYLGKALLPLHLIPVYPRWQIDPASALAYVPGLLLVAVFLICWWQRGGWGKAMLFGLGYAVLMLLPVLGFLDISFFKYSLVADHWQYFSIIGPVALVAAALTAGWKSWGGGNPRLGIVLGGALLLALGLLTRQQAAVYRNSETLWQTTIDRNPNCWLAHYNLGLILNLRGETDAAIRHLQEAIRLKPDCAGAYNSLGIALLNQGRTDAATRQLQEAIRLQPDFAEAHNSLGLALANQHLPDAAAGEFQEAIRLKPDYADAHNNLGTIFYKNGRVDEAIRQFQAAIQIQPAYAEAHFNLGSVLSNAGQTDAAISQFREAIRINPDYAKAHNNLGLALLNQGQTAAAAGQFQEALRLNPDYADAKSNLAKALELKNK